MVEPETFEFLEGLAANNKKAWMDENRAEFDDAKRNFAGIAMTLHSYADRYDPFIGEARLKPKQSFSKLFQEPRERVGRALYRADVDVYANAGHPTETVGYFLHIEPGNCYAGAGLPAPSKPALARMRSILSGDPAGLQDALSDPDFSAAFPQGLFSRKTLNVVPEGFDASDPAAPYLKMVGLACRHDISDEDMLDDDVIDAVTSAFRAASGLVRYFGA